MKLHRAIAGWTLALLWIWSGDTSAQVATEFSAGITPGSQPRGITLGPDGNLWFTESLGSRIGRITPSGTVTEFNISASAVDPRGITTGPDGNLWFTEYAAGRIGRITPLGVVTEFSDGISVNAGPMGITTGPDGNLWFTESISGNRIGRITPSGEIIEFSAGISPGAFPVSITLGPDGNLWFTEPGLARIGRITPEGVVTEFGAGISADSRPVDITSGPDGNLWFVDNRSDRVGRITPSGVVTEFGAGITLGAWPQGITAGPDGNLWFTEYPGRIGRITPQGTVTEFSSGITSVSFPIGIRTGPDGRMWFAEINSDQIGRIDTAADSTTNFQGLWWNANESGWGINFAHQGDQIFATWYTYDTTGKALWLTMLAARASPGGTTFTGPIYVDSGPPFNNYIGSATPTKVGSGTLTYTDINTGSFAYSVNGVAQTKAITRYQLNTGPQLTCTYSTATPNFAAATNYQDLWWTAGEPGWGINLAHQGNDIFATWYTYNSDGSPLWLSALLKRQAPYGSFFVGLIYANSGSRFDAFDATRVKAASIGWANLNFVEGYAAGQFDYSVTIAPFPGPIRGTKTITRFAFSASGGTVCTAKACRSIAPTC